MTSTCAVLGALLLATGGSGPGATVPLYTNEDLDRVHPYRGETGVLCVPAAEPAATPPAARRGGRAALSEDAAQEAFWRREASRHRKRIARLERAVSTLRRQIDQQQKQKGSGRRRTGVSLESLETRLAEIQAEIEEAESEFEERSRRAGALPGWLR